MLAKQGLFLQTQTTALDACLPWASWTQDMPYGRLRPGCRLKVGPLPDALWQEGQHRAHAQCPQWGAYRLLTEGYQIYQTPVLERSAHQLTDQALDCQATSKTDPLATRKIDP